MAKLPEKLQKARSSMVLDQPFFGVLALKLKYMATEAISTMATNGTYMYYNPKFLDSLTLHETMGVVVHEVLHCVFHHMTRRGDRDPKKWNVACDYAINLLVQDAGFVLPKLDGICLDEQYRNMTADHIYSLMPDPPELYVNFGEVLDAGKDANGNPMTGPGNTPIDGATVEVDWEIATKQAAQVAKGVGKLPGGLESIIDTLLKPQVDWKEKLRNFMQIAKDEHNWTRPNRRFIGAGLYLPSMHSERVGDIVVGIDSSGSVSDAELQAFLSEMSSILSDTNPTCVHLVVCDTRVNSYATYTRDDLPLKSVKIGGRGGTMFSPVFEYVKEKQIEPEALVYLTDLGSSDFGDTPDYPVMWVSTCDPYCDVPFGDITRIEVNH